MRARLVVIQGPDQGTRFEFEGYGRIVIGRAGSRDVRDRCPTDPYLSRFHFLLEMAGAECVARDLGSRSGIRVNGLRHDLATLRPGDLLKAGHSTFRLEFVSASTVPPASSTSSTTVTFEGPSLDDYDDLEYVAEGGLGLVYRGRERLTGRTVAVKMLRPERAVEDAAVEHFLREMELWRRLQHPYIVRVYAVGRDPEGLWLAMEYVDGPTLQEQVEIHGPIEVDDAHRIGLELLAALAHGHGQGIVHRDVKPANVLLVGETGGLTSKLTDYGLAKNFLETCGAPLTITGDVKGTPYYMAPEQLLDAKRVGPAADLYSVGATLYFALTGAWHFDDGTGGTNRWSLILDGPYVPLADRRPDVPRPMAQTVDRALDRQIRYRPATADAMAQDLNSYLHGGYQP